MQEQQNSALSDALDSLWAKFLPEINERVGRLEDAASAFSSGQLADDQQEEAHAAAHKLAGVLGTFGLTEGTSLARELELMFSQCNGRDPAQGARMAEIAAQLRTIVASRK